MSKAEVLEAPKPVDSRAEKIEQWLGPLSEGDRAIVDAVDAIPSEDHPTSNRTRLEEEDGTKIKLFRSKDREGSDESIDPEKDGVLKDVVEVRIINPDGTEESAWVMIDASALTRRGDGIFAGVRGPSAGEDVSVFGDAVNGGEGKSREDHEAAEAVKAKIAQKINEARERAFPVREVDSDLAHDAALAEKPHMDDIYEERKRSGHSHLTVADIDRSEASVWSEADKTNMESARLADEAAKRALKAAGVDIKQPKKH